MADQPSQNGKPRRGPRRAEDRVKGLLVMLPWLVKQGGPVELSEMAERFDISVEHLIKDLELATLCGRPPYTPADYIELIIEDGSVVATMSRFIEHSPALTVSEGLAVLTALKSANGIAGSESEEALSSLMQKLERVLASYMDTIDVDLASPDHLGELREALTKNETVAIQYFAPAKAEITEREITPAQIFTDRGRWYVRGYDSKSADERTFRVDRIQSAQRTGRTGKVLRLLSAPGRFFSANNKSLTLVKIEIGPSDEWVIDNYPVESVTKQGDGRSVVALYATSEHWMGRLLVRLSPDAKVLEPRRWRSLRRTTAQTILARYK